jgi:lipoprotein-releasing system permease protein
MSFELFVSLRLLFSKKKHHAIHVISLISILGVVVGTMALVTVLSVFNGFDSVIKSMYTDFDPDLKILPREGKFFQIDSALFQKIRQTEGVEDLAWTVEESVLLQYDNRQYIASIKGVSDNFLTFHNLQKKITSGKSVLQKDKFQYAMVGQGVAYYLGINPDLFHPVIFYMPRKDADLFTSPENAFQRLMLYPSSIFSIEQEIDSKYVIVPLAFAHKLLENNNILSNLEVKVKNGYSLELVQKQLQQITGGAFEIQDRYRQHTLLFKIMKSEKWAIFFILTFILIVASLNIISSLTMLILEKKKNINILHHLGADWKSIRKIFLLNGWLNVIIGSVVGLILGLLLCWIQQRFGIVKLQGMSSFIIQSYPVKVVLFDVLLIFITCVVIGWLAAIIPVRMISEKYFHSS